jgi:hypothetical protein
VFTKLQFFIGPSAIPPTWVVRIGRRPDHAPANTGVAYYAGYLEAPSPDGHTGEVIPLDQAPRARAGEPSGRPRSRTSGPPQARCHAAAKLVHELCAADRTVSESCGKARGHFHSDLPQIRDRIVRGPRVFRLPSPVRASRR